MAHTLEKVAPARRPCAKADALNCKDNATETCPAPFGSAQAFQIHIGVIFFRFHSYNSYAT